LAASADRSNGDWNAHRLVALTRLDRPEEADAALRTVRRQGPEFTVEYARRKLFHLKRGEQLELYLGAPADAGAPAHRTGALQAAVSDLTRATARLPRQDVAHTHERALTHLALLKPDVGRRGRSADDCHGN
jgi:hypothetical protein